MSNVSGCLPLRPIFARMKSGSFSKSNFRKKTKPVYNMKQEEITVTETEPSPPPSQPARSLSENDSDKEVHISQCSLEYDSEKEVHFPAKTVVARVLSPEPRENGGSLEDGQQQPRSVNSKSPTPSYRTVDSSQDPEVVTDQMFPAIDEEPEEMIEQGEDDDEEEELASDAESEDDIHLPLQDFDGRDIVPHNARLHRPPSWDYGVPLWPTVTNTSIVSGIGTYVDPVSPMSPAQEKPAFTFPPPSDIKTPISNKRNSWRNTPEYRATTWV